MNKLRSLKDFQEHSSYMNENTLSHSNLRDEAVKYIKDYEKAIEDCKKDKKYEYERYDEEKQALEGEIDGYESIIHWIKSFFNIGEGDLE